MLSHIVERRLRVYLVLKLQDFEDDDGACRLLSRFVSTESNTGAFDAVIDYAILIE